MVTSAGFPVRPSTPSTSPPGLRRCVCVNVWTAWKTRAGGLEVTDSGRIAVDRTMRSVSHRNIYAVGDSVHAIGDNGRPLPMSCASAGYTSDQAIAAIVGRLTAREVANKKLIYTYNHIS